MKKITLTLLVLAVIGGGTAAVYLRKGMPEPVVITVPLTRGDIAEVVSATGTLEAVETVDVGTQVSGVVQEMSVDFNSIVRKGQVIARLDPSIIQTQIEQASANVARAEADLDRLRVNLADAERKYEQAKMMYEKQLIPRDQLETAELNVKTQNSQIKSSEAGLVQSQSQLNTQQVNLGHTVIRAPIDGIVISRNVDQGQTVAASMNAPVLYVLAADLTKMQVVANIDESEIGRMRPGQPVTFRVDAYPSELFHGTVMQVRLQPATVQNVVTYSTVISVPNPDYKLKPGMTANVTIEIARKNNVLRAPAAALRFRPSNDVFAALRQEPPAEMTRAFGRGGPRAQGGGANLTPEQREARRKQFEERMTNMSPEERERMQQRGGSRRRGAPEVRAGRGGNPSRQGTGARDAQVPSRLATTEATTVDALFAPLPPTERPGRVWLFVNKQLKAVNVRTGVSDGTWTEILDGGDAAELQPDTEVVTSIVTGLETQARPGQQNPGASPLMPQRGNRRGGGPGGRGR